MAWRRLHATRGARHLLAAALLLAAGGMADAKTFRWANDGDANSMDPYARQETFLLAFDQNMYEPLIRRNREMGLEPGLATEWARRSPTVWRFKLRQGVKFHDGTPFTADDVVFSFDRATHPGSNIASPLGDDPGGRRRSTSSPSIWSPTGRTRSCPAACRPRDHVEEMVRGAQHRPAPPTSPRTRRATPPATPTAPGRSC